MGSHTPPDAKNTAVFAVQQPGGKVLNIWEMQQGDAAKTCMLTKTWKGG